jgi:hypothetical protein
MNYTLSNEAIAHVAKLLQMAILSGTDVVDHLRMMKLDQSSEDDSTLVLSDEYRSISDKQIENMLGNIENLSAQQ